MRPCSWLCALVVALGLSAGCTSPGTPFTYKDAKVGLGPTASVIQPIIGQDVTISFSLRNTWNQPLSGSEAVYWELWETGAAPTLLTSGTDPIPAFASVAKTFLVTAPTKGTHTYEVRVDPNNVISEQDETNNVSATLTVLVADQDIAFSAAPAPTVTWPTTPNSTDTPTLTFTLTNTVNVAQVSPAASINVPFALTLNGSALAYTATPSSPAAVAANGSTAISVALPATGSAGTFVYTITLTPADGDDSNIGNNTATVMVVIPAPG